MPLTKDLIKRCAYNDVFVETGTLFGDGVRNALWAGFKEIHSIEEKELVYVYIYKKFSDCDNVKLHLGDSSKILFDVIKNINKRITFWLDAHDAQIGPDGPLLEELKAIARHPIKEHTILIDDIDSCPVYGLSFEIILEHLKEINPRYSFEKYQTKKMVLIAEVK